MHQEQVEWIFPRNLENLIIMIRVLIYPHVVFFFNDALIVPIEKDTPDLLGPFRGCQMPTCAAS